MNTLIPWASGDRRGRPHENKRTLYQRENGLVERRTTIPTASGRNMEFCEVRDTYSRTTLFALTSTGSEIWSSNLLREEDAVTWRATLEQQLGGRLEEILQGLTNPDEARRILEIFCALLQ